MKKKFLTLVLILVAVIGISGFAQSEKSAFEAVVEACKKNATDAPSGTVFGIVESTPQKYVVNTPIGKYDVEKQNGGFSFMGIYAKLRSRKGSVYTVESSLGDYVINLKKCTIVKQ
jgi:hypothetical protein